jgi:hypothetical protein
MAGGRPIKGHMTGRFMRLLTTPTARRQGPAANSPPASRILTALEQLSIKQCEVLLLGLAARLTTRPDASSGTAFH